jgi:hypothetical protein
MPETPDERLSDWKIIEVTEPIAGLDELYEHDRARYANPTAERILGQVGRMIAGSKSGYARAFTDNLPVFNANLSTHERGKIWFGDVDCFIDEPLLADIARALGEQVFALYESAARFGNEETPDLSDFVIAVAPDGTVETSEWIVRDAAGVLRPRRPSNS